MEQDWSWSNGTTRIYKDNYKKYLQESIIPSIKKFISESISEIVVPSGNCHKDT